jgi:hypothetical protein
MNHLSWLCWGDKARVKRLHDLIIAIAAESTIPDSDRAIIMYWACMVKPHLCHRDPEEVCSQGPRNVPIIRAIPAHVDDAILAIGYRDYCLDCNCKMNECVDLTHVGPSLNRRTFLLSRIHMVFVSCALFVTTQKSKAALAEAQMIRIVVLYHLGGLSPESQDLYGLLHALAVHPKPPKYDYPLLAQALGSAGLPTSFAKILKRYKELHARDKNLVRTQPDSVLVPMLFEG